MKRSSYLVIALFCCTLSACKDQPANHPHPKKTANGSVYHSSFAESPKTLDPAKAYTLAASVFNSQIYEPPLQYHYLKRPYQLIPLTATNMPTIRYYNKAGRQLAANAPDKNIAYSTYDVHIKPGIFYQPHPALADNRELTADDYVYQIKRLAHPQLNSPIFGFLSQYIVGLNVYANQLKKKYLPGQFLDLQQYHILGVKVLGRYHYQIKIKGKYPQFIYWLAMNFFAPIPPEVDRYYSQPGRLEKNMTLDWHPVGTGPYMMTENNPNRRMVLEKNPNYHSEYYPTEGEPADKSKGMLADAGKQLPFINQLIFSLEKESIPRWNKFLQGYYDSSALTSDSFDQAVQIDNQGNPRLTEEMQQQKIKLYTTISPGIFFMGFNMQDNVVGGNSERARKLRHAIALVIDYEEMIAIFLNGRGIPAQGPIPPGLFGHKTGKAGINPYIYDWSDNKAVRKPLSYAKKLLAQAGYANGINPKTGKPLILNYDVAASGDPDDKARFEWMREQFAKLGIQLNVRSTLYNRFQQKIRSGNTQIFSWGWHADYPDPENFLFLLFGPNGKVKFGGENAVNYSNKEFDRLFIEMKSLPNGPKRQKIIDQMVNILRHDAPWVWGFHQIDFVLAHNWNQNIKLHGMSSNTLKYRRINNPKRMKMQQEWNKAILWPIILLLLIFIAALIPVFIKYWRHRHKDTIERF